MFCNKCGREIGDGAILCDDCNSKTVPEDRMAERARQRGRKLPTIEWSTEGFPPTDIKTDDVWEFIEKTTRNKAENVQPVAETQSENASVSYSETPTINDIMARPELFGMKEDLEALEKELFSDMEFDKKTIEDPMVYVENADNERAQRILDENHAKLSENYNEMQEDDVLTTEALEGRFFEKDDNALRYDNFILESEAGSDPTSETLESMKEAAFLTESIDATPVVFSKEEHETPYAFVPPIFTPSSDNEKEYIEPQQQGEPYEFESHERWLDREPVNSVEESEFESQSAEEELFDLLAETETPTIPEEDAVLDIDVTDDIADIKVEEVETPAEIETIEIEDSMISDGGETVDAFSIGTTGDPDDIDSVETETVEVANVEIIDAINSPSDSSDAQEGSAEVQKADEISTFEPETVESLTMEDLFGDDIFQELQKEEDEHVDTTVETEVIAAVDDAVIVDAGTSDYSEEIVPDELLGATIRVMPKNPDAEKTETTFEDDMNDILPSESKESVEVSDEGNAVEDVPVAGRMSLNEVFDEEIPGKKSKKEKKSKRDKSEKTEKNSPAKKIGLVFLKLIAAILILYILLQVTMIVAVEFFPDTAFSDWAINLESAMFDLLMGS